MTDETFAETWQRMHRRDAEDAAANASERAAIAAEQGEAAAAEDAAFRQMMKRRFEFESELDASVHAIAESRTGIPGAHPTTRDVAAASANVAFRVGYPVDAEALEKALSGPEMCVDQDLNPVFRHDELDED